MAADDADHAVDGGEAMTGAVRGEQFSIGFGCSTRATGDDVLRLIAAAIGPIPAGTTLATLDRRASIGGAVAAKLGLRLMLFPAATLAGVEDVTTRSLRALAETQTASVAEASALASLGPSARLVVPRVKGRFCTCAVAARPMEARP